IEAGKLSWTSTPLDVFPEWKDTIHPAFRQITLEQLLSHHAGIAAYDYTGSKEFKALPKMNGNGPQQRMKFAAWVLQHPPAIPPGTKGLYSQCRILDCRCYGGATHRIKLGGLGNFTGVRPAGNTRHLRVAVDSG
ncbi:MAG: serine hydrolase, partial [Acidobacteriota bacterium]